MTNTPPPDPYAPPGGGYGYGARRVIPPQVNTASILLFIGGGFGILGGFLLLAAGGGISGIFTAIGVFLLVVGAIQIWVGLALRQLKPWSRMAAIALAAIGGIFALISMFQGAYTNIIGLALDVAVIYMLSQPQVVRAFDTGQP